ncbi:hypothetical protein WA158_006614 [Blastocystis sp. Blastoise]
MYILREVSKEDYRSGRRTEHRRSRSRDDRERRDVSRRGDRDDRDDRSHRSSRHHTRSPSSSRHHRHHHERSASRGQSSRRSERVSVHKSQSRHTARPDTKKKRKSNFDILPEGIPEELIQAGVDFSKIATGYALNNFSLAQQPRSQRRLHFGNLVDCTQEELCEFVENIVKKCVNQNVALPCTIGADMHCDKGYALVEFKSAEVCSACLVLSGLIFKGQPIKVNRPIDYDQFDITSHIDHPIALDLSKLEMNILGESKEVPLNPLQEDSKIFIGNIPPLLTESQLYIFELNKGYAYIIFDTKEDAEKVCNEMNNFPLGEETITVRMAKKFGSSADTTSPVATAVSPDGTVSPIVETPTPAPTPATTNFSDNLISPEGAMVSPIISETKQTLTALTDTIDASTEEGKTVAASLLQQATSNTTQTMKLSDPSRVLILYNMITKEELANDEEYMDIKNDIETECTKYGQVLSVIIPRKGEAGSGTVLVEYATIDQACIAAVSIIGRKFNKKYLRLSFMPEAKFTAKQY